MKQDLQTTLNSPAEPGPGSTSPAGKAKPESCLGHGGWEVRQWLEQRLFSFITRMHTKHLNTHEVGSNALLHFMGGKQAQRGSHRLA